MNQKSIPKVFLIVLDGFGIGKNYPFNAIQNAKMPFYKSITKKFPMAQLLTCGEAVGLPPLTMGNSEVGHMNMGAGRIVYQDLTRINKAIRDKEFENNKVIKKCILESKNNRIHFMGLCSDAGVHSHLDHLKSLIKMTPLSHQILLHLFTDGRDTSPTSGAQYLKNLKNFLIAYPNTRIASLSGRYYAMDRDQRWDRIEKAWKVITGQSELEKKPNTPIFSDLDDAINYIESNYQKGITDEFIIPKRFGHENDCVQDGDSVLFFNFRSDRARQLTYAFTRPNFNSFTLGIQPKLANYTCMTEYDRKENLNVAFGPQNQSNILPDVLTQFNLGQFRCAETEKYAHVTFFFNGGREAAYPNEHRTLIPSTKEVPTYDLKPEMSAYEVAQAVDLELQKQSAHFVLTNFANPDMVGHTGNYEAAIKALIAVDKCLEQTVNSALKNNYEIIITADHGNIEEMRDCTHDEPHTQHTLNPVPLHFISNHFKYTLKDGILSDIAPSILEIMGLTKPNEMTSSSFLKGSRL